MSGLLSDRSGLLKRCVGGVTRKQHSDNLDFTKIIVSTDVIASNGARMGTTSNRNAGDSRTEQKKMLARCAKVRETDEETLK